MISPLRLRIWGWGTNDWQARLRGKRDPARLLLPASRVEQLKGDRAGQWSIRVNDQFRICFRWTGTVAEDVEIVDYH